MLSQRDPGQATLRNVSEVFAETSSQLGTVGLTKPRIDTDDAYPIRQWPRHLPVAQQETEAGEFQAMLDKDIIDPCPSSWSSRVVLVNPVLRRLSSIK